MDWEFNDGIQPLSVRSPAGPEEGALTLVDSLTVKLADGTVIPLFAIHDPCLPEFGGLELLSGIAFVLADRHPAGYFLVSRKALFIQKGERSFTPIYVWYDGKFSRQALWMGGSPDQVLQNARAGVEFTDERFGNVNCMIPIAVNVLDEGYVVAEVAKPELPWVGVGEPWRMPFFDRSQLAKLRIAI